MKRAGFFLLSLLSQGLFGCGNSPPPDNMAGGAVPTAPQSQNQVLASGPVPGLSPEQLAQFVEGKEAFADDESAEPAFGPLFNGKSCVECHNAPVEGGAGIQVETRFGRQLGASFDPLPGLGGSLLQREVVAGATPERVPAEANMVAGRRATSILGAGLIEAIPDAAIRDYAAFQATKFPGQAGQVNLVAGLADGVLHVGRFGWKCQLASLLDFSGDAYANEMGISSAVFPVEHVANAASKVVAMDQVEDQPGADGVRDIDRFTHFMRFLAPLPRTTTSPRGEQTFHAIGCAVCHKPDYPTVSSIPALDGQVISAYSDFLLHDVGTGDGIEQGSAPANKLRTAPLMGLVHLQGLLHDGSAPSLNEAILAHSVEAAGARQKYLNLSIEERRDLEAFLQSL